MFGLEPSTFGARAARIRALVLDVDGVLTDGRLRFGPQGETLKVFHAHDGLGIKMLMHAGVEVAVVTARSSSMVELRCSQLGIRHVLMGRGEKRSAVQELAHRLDVPLEDFAFMGDDVIDLPAMRTVGLSLSVAGAHPLVRNEASWVSTRPGGGGAVRELCDTLIAARTDLADFVESYLESLSETPAGEGLQ